MRIFLLLCLTLCVCVAVAFGQSGGGSDLDSIRVVRSALADRSGGLVVIHSFTQKHVERLGDEVSIVLLKILDENELNSEVKVREYLPIIQTAFDKPQFIKMESNKSPTVTLQLLDHLQQTLSDPSLQQLVLETIEFVKRKTVNLGN